MVNPLAVPGFSPRVKAEYTERDLPPRLKKG
jgi:hypothetical protein